MPKRYEIPEDELRELYLSDERSIQECADHFGCSSTLIEFRLQRYDIPTRAPGSEPVDIPEETLYELYVETGLTTLEIAERFDCHNSTISRKLEQYDIPTYGSNHGHAVDISEDELVTLYVEEERTTYELAERYDCDPTVIERRLRWYGVETRHTTAGDGDWEHKYGSNWRKQRRKALERADYRCEICGTTDGEHRMTYVDETRGIGLGLDVHHRVSARLFERWEAASIEDANSLSNLEVLCQACHAEHGDRVGTSESRA